MAETPRLSAEQRASALRKAVAVRSARRAFKDEVARGHVPLAEAIARAKESESLAGIRVYDLLQCLPGVGPKRATAFMAAAAVAPSRRVRGLGEHQAAVLISAVDS